MSISVLMQHNNPGRTGTNLAETTLNTSNVNVNEFGMVFKHAVNGQIYAQPLYVPFVSIQGKGVHNAVFVVTMNNWVYAFDADNADGPNAQPLWAHQLENRPPIPARIYTFDSGETYPDIIGNIGILGTPVIDTQIGASPADPTTGTMYLVLATWDEARFANDQLGAFKQLLYALDLADGQPRALANGRPNPVEIAGSVPGSGYGKTVPVTVKGKKNIQVPDGTGGNVTFQAMQHLQRPGLLLKNGAAYIAFGSHADIDPYHGWVFAYDAATLQQRSIFCSTPTGEQAGIWQAGEGLVGDLDGNVYVGSGDGTNPITGAAQTNLGDSFIKLALIDGGLTLAGWLHVKETVFDQDLGAASPTLLPDGNLVGGGKDGNFYLFDPLQMDTQGSGQSLLQKFIASFGAGTRPNTKTHHIHGSPVVWDSPNHSTLVYVWGENDVLRAYRYDPLQHRFPGQPGPGGGQGTPLARGTIYASNDAMPPRQAMPGGMLSISANGLILNTGIVWGAFPAFGDANHQTVEGHLVAYDASSFDSQGRIVAIWSSHQNPRRDDYGNFPKFCCPTIANGRVYQATFSNQLVVYGLLQQPDGGYNLGFGGATGLTLNGNARSADGRVRLTGRHQFQAGSAFHTTPVNVERFQSMFRFLLGHAQADGITFTIQVEGPRALGSSGGGLGYGPDPNDPTQTFRITRSVAVKFDLFDNQTGQQTSSTGLYQNGDAPTGAGDIALAPHGIDLHADTPFQVNLTYDGHILSVTIRDEVKGVSATQTYTVDIPAVTGPTAYVGFTGATGGLEAEQDILCWQFG